MPNPSRKPERRRPFWHSWFQSRDLNPLLDKMPARRHVVLELVWMAYVLVGMGAAEQALGRSLGELVGGVLWQWGNAVVLSLVGVFLLSPGRAWSEGKRGLALLLVAGAVVPTLLMVSSPDTADGPRIGVAPSNSSSGLDESRQVARIQQVIPGTPASGKLRVGDGIVSVNGRALAPDDPAGDLVARANDDSFPAGATVFRVEREGQLVDVALDLPPPPSSTTLARALRRTFVRNAALLLFLGLLVWRDGQGVASLGLEREGFWRQAAFGGPALLMLVLAHFVVSLVTSLFALALGGEIIEAEVGQRRALTEVLVTERFVWMVALVTLASTTEEVVFRGFMLPRLRHAVGSWASAVGITAVVFGLGHLYEGTIGTVQTMGISVVLSLVFLLRRHLMPCIVAHLGFNLLAIVLAYLFLSWGFFEQLGEVLGS